MQSTPNPYRARNSGYYGPRTLGGLAAYLLMPPMFVALLAVPGIVLSLLLGALSALVVAKLKDNPALATVVEESRSMPSWLPTSRQ